MMTISMAAGTAEDVEIAMELDSGVTEEVADTTETTEAPETPETKKK